MNLLCKLYYVNVLNCIRLFMNMNTQGWPCAILEPDHSRPVYRLCICVSVAAVHNYKLNLFIVAIYFS